MRPSYHDGRRRQAAAWNAPRIRGTELGHRERADVLGQGRRDDGPPRPRATPARAPERHAAARRARPVLPRPPRRARRGAPRVARRARAACPSPPRPTCATAFPTASSPCRWTTWCACTPPRAPRATPRSSTTPGRTSRRGATCWPGACTWPACGRHDVFQNMMGYGLFTGGIGFHYGAERLGALTIPIGPGNSKRQLWFMQQFQTTVVHILPSYALRLATFFDEIATRPAEGPQPAHRLRRRRAAHRGDRGEDRGRLRDQGLQLLRPLRDVRPRGRLRVPEPGRPAPLGGPLPPRDHRPRHGADACPTASGASWS